MPGSKYCTVKVVDVKGCVTLWYRETSTLWRRSWDYDKRTVRRRDENWSTRVGSWRRRYRRYVCIAELDISHFCQTQPTQPKNFEPNPTQANVSLP